MSVTHVTIQRADGTDAATYPVLPVTNLAFERQFGIGMAAARRDPHVEHDYWLAWDAERRAGKPNGSFDEWTKTVAPMASATITKLNGEQFTVPVFASSYIAFERHNGIGMSTAGDEGRMEHVYWIVKDAVQAAGHVVMLTVDEWVADLAAVDLEKAEKRPISFAEKPNPFATAAPPAD